MKRRGFIKNSIRLSSSMVLPGILPSGSLFAKTGERKVNHIVYCLFAGGVRNFESVDQAEGNLMPNLLKGNASVSSDIRDGMSKIPGVTKPPIQQFGTLFKRFSYNSSQTIHYNAHAAAISGVYRPKIAIMQPVDRPTIFEFYRKHNSPSMSALNAWWISDKAGPFPYLNFSNHQDYGPKFGANLLHPSSITKLGAGAADLKLNKAAEQRCHELTGFLNRYHGNRLVSDRQSVLNSLEDKNRLINFFGQLQQKFGDIDESGIFDLDPGSSNTDLLNIFSAIQVLNIFEPELLVVNMQGIDVCHQNFTSYCDNIRKADHAVRRLWDSIQENPRLKDDTVLIVVPEFGRNRKPNTIKDKFGRLAIDHTGDEISQRMFCLVAGPPDVVNQNKVVNSREGELIDIVPTIAKLLGFDHDMPLGACDGRYLQEAFR